MRDSLGAHRKSLLYFRCKKQEFSQPELYAAQERGEGLDGGGLKAVAEQLFYGSSRMVHHASDDSRLVHLNALAVSMV